ncbi:MAG: hypothetical protein KC776_06380 [Myxococcales bacterium]|nr:hypothetical protein [Myxococcales bacterium]MCB9578748.1 hypothetical protein [Polyangiaceae bacterium]
MKRLLVPLALLLVFGCEDPVARDRGASLGPDRGGYEAGPLHRAGDPCTWCHTKGGTAHPHFDLAGTVYPNKDSSFGLEGVTVRLFDSAGRQQTVGSNFTGNFFLDEGALALSFPLWVKVEYQGQVAVMKTPIFRERSCSACHRRTQSSSSVGPVTLEESP